MIFDDIQGSKNCVGIMGVLKREQIVFTGVVVDFLYSMGVAVRMLSEISRLGGAGEIQYTGVSSDGPAVVSFYALPSAPVLGLDLYGLDDTDLNLINFSSDFEEIRIYSAGVCPLALEGNTAYMHGKKKLRFVLSSGYTIFEGVQFALYNLCLLVDTWLITGVLPVWGWRSALKYLHEYVSDFKSVGNLDDLLSYGDGVQDVLGHGEYLERSNWEFYIRFVFCIMWHKRAFSMWIQKGTWSEGGVMTVGSPLWKVLEEAFDLVGGNKSKFMGMCKVMILDEKLKKQMLKVYDWLRERG